MKIVKNATLWSLLILISLTDSGCSKKEEEVDRSEARSAFYVKVKKEADQTEPDKLRIEVMKYQEEIIAKKLEAEELRTKLQTVPFEEISVEDAKRLEELNESISALKTRYNVYFQELRNKGEDINDLQI
jgi:predicted  nucleic acid-binding Zn-ribbon protein